MSDVVAGTGRGAVSASWPPAARWVLGVAGAGLAVSVFLPWLTLFAGLRSYRGLTGPTGVVVLVAGAWLVVAALEHRRAVRFAWVLAAAAVVWSASGVFALRQTPSQRMLVPDVGAGIWMALACLALASVPVWRARPSPLARFGRVAILPSRGTCGPRDVDVAASEDGTAGTTWGSATGR